MARPYRHSPPSMASGPRCCATMNDDRTFCAVEFDRATVRLAVLKAKFAAYFRYPLGPMWRPAGASRRQPSRGRPDAGRISEMPQVYADCERKVWGCHSVRGTPPAPVWVTRL
jgi:hypothetical protein